VNRTTVQPSTVLPRRSRRVLTRRRSSLTGSCVDRRSSVLRSTITFTSSMPAKNTCRLSKSAVSFGRTTMSTATPGSDREGRSSRSWSLWPSQMLCVTPPSSSGSRSPRSPGLPSWRHHAQTTFIAGKTVGHPASREQEPLKGASVIRNQPFTPRRPPSAAFSGAVANVYAVIGAA